MVIISGGLLHSLENIPLLGVVFATGGNVILRRPDLAALGNSRYYAATPEKVDSTFSQFPSWGNLSLLRSPVYQPRRQGERPVHDSIAVADAA
jgi:hypothetical protein